MRPYRQPSIWPGVLLAFFLLLIGFFVYLALTATPAHGREPAIWTWDPVQSVEDCISQPEFAAHFASMALELGADPQPGMQASADCGEGAGYRIRLWRAEDGKGRKCPGTHWIKWAETQDTQQTITRWPRNTRLTYVIVTSYIGNLESENRERRACP